MDATSTQPTTPRATTSRGKRSVRKQKGPKARINSALKTRVVDSRRRPERPKGQRPFPRETLEDALRVPYALKEKNGGNPWPPADVASAVGLSKANPTFFYIAAASRDFGMTEGSRDSAQIALTPFGRELVYATSKAEELEKLREAFNRVEIFRKVLEYYRGTNLPEMQYLGNSLVREFGLDPVYHEEFSKVFRENCTYLKEVGASLDPTPQAAGRRPEVSRVGSPTVIMAESKVDTGLRCFVAMPFRERDSARANGFFDEVMRALIAPAGREAGFEVVTANRDGSDVIQSTIVNQLLDADLVIADLTENNPNVLFELGLRIAEDRPVALIRAKGTPAIFDVDNMLRVFEYNPNLWTSNIDHDLPKLTDHIRASWDSRENGRSFMKILRQKVES
jgi:hypothetical protein